MAAAPMIPDVAAVVSRSMCLASLAVRGLLESATLLCANPDDRGAYDELILRQSRWLNEQDFTAVFTYRELEALSAAPGTWSTAEHDAHAERMEALGVLLWALDSIENFSTYDQPFAPANLEALVGWRDAAMLMPAGITADQFPVNGAASLKQAQLRPQPFIAAQRASADCWKWRNDVAALQRSGASLAPGQNLDVMIGIAAQEAHAAGAIARPISNDFPMQNKPFSQVSEAEQLQCARRTEARKLALDWLCGYATAWDAVPSIAEAA